VKRLKLLRARNILAQPAAAAVAIALVLAAVSFYAAAGAETRPVRVGVLTPGRTFNPVLAGLKAGLDRLGYREEKNLRFIVEDSNGAISDLDQRVRRLNEAGPDVIFTVTTPHSLAAKKAATTAPVVFAWVGDPIRSGLIVNYASSQSNLTGITSYSGPLSGKRLEILKQIAPATKRVLAIVSPNEVVARESFQMMQSTAKRLGIQVVRRDVTNKEQIEKVLEGSFKGSVDAIYHVPSTLVGVYIDLVVKKAREDKIPLVAHETLMVEQGALCAFGADFRLIGRQAARLVVKMLSGEKPWEIPTEIPEELLLVLNTTTAKVIGLKIPRSVLSKVDRVVE
jgi:putative ABC transport system substrate-binding protein